MTDKYWIEGTSGDSDDDLLWSLSSGGSNDTTAPGPADKVILDDNGLGACNWKTAEVTDFDILIAYTAVITLSLTLFVSNDFTFVTNATSKLVQNSFDLNVDGLYKVTGAGLGVVSAVGDTTRMNGDIIITNSVMSHYKGDVFSRHSMATPDLAKTHDVDWPDDKSMAEVRTWGKNQTIRLTGGLTSAADKFESGTIFTDDGVGIKAWIIIGVLVTPENCTFIASSGGAIRISVQNVATPKGADFDQFRIFIRNNVDTIEGVWITDDVFAFQNFNTGITETVNITGSINSTDFEIGVSGLPNAGYDVQASGSQVNAKGNVIIYESDGIETNRLGRSAGVLDASITGNLTVQDLAELDFAGNSGFMFIGGNISLSATAVINWGDVTVVYIGGADVTIDYGGNAPKKTINMKSGGIASHITGYTLSAGYFSRPNGNTNTKFQVGEVFVIAFFDLANVGSVRETIDSSDGATAVAVTNTSNGPIGRNTNVANITLAVGDQKMDENTCIDGGNNTNFDFDDLPILSDDNNGYGFGPGPGIGIGIGVY